MKRVLFFAAFFLFVTVSVYSQNKFSIGVSGAAAIPQQGTTGAGTFLSISYKPFDNFAVLASAGFVGWGNSQVYHYTHTIGYFSLSGRYLFKLEKFYPYLSGEIGFAKGRYRYDPTGYDEYSGDWKVLRHEFINLSEILSGAGAGFMYPLWDRLFLDTSFNIILTTQTTSLFHSRFSVGMNYEL